MHAVKRAVTESPLCQTVGLFAVGAVIAVLLQAFSFPDLL